MSRARGEPLGEEHYPPGSAVFWGLVTVAIATVVGLAAWRGLWVTAGLAACLVPFGAMEAWDAAKARLGRTQ